MLQLCCFQLAQELVGSVRTLSIFAPDALKALALSIMRDE